MARVSFSECVTTAFSTKELVAEFDRLGGTNLLLQGTPLDVEIDWASGRVHRELQLFIEFVRDCIWDRLPDDVRGDFA